MSSGSVGVSSRLGTLGGPPDRKTCSEPGWAVVGVSLTDSVGAAVVVSPAAGSVDAADSWLLDSLSVATESVVASDSEGAADSVEDIAISGEDVEAAVDAVVFFVVVVDPAAGFVVVGGLGGFDVVGGLGGFADEVSAVMVEPTTAEAFVESCEAAEDDVVVMISCDSST